MTFVHITLFAYEARSETKENNQDIWQDLSCMAPQEQAKDKSPAQSPCLHLDIAGSVLQKCLAEQLTCGAMSLAGKY